MNGFVKRGAWLSILMLTLVAWNAEAQITYFFQAGDLSETPDRFGNVYRIGPKDAILSIPTDDPAIEGILFEEDNLWTIYPYIGNRFLISHAPGFWEDAPELTAEITVAQGGKYEVILFFLDSNADPGTGPIQAALGDEDLVMYSADNSIAASGGTTPSYPIAGDNVGSAWWYTVSLGEVEVAAGEDIKVRIDDVPGDKFDILAELEVGSTFQGIQLKVLELSGTLSEIQVSPGEFDWFTDISGNQYKTGPVDEAAFPTQDDWLTITTREDGSGKWNIRQGLGPFGPILESFPGSGNDAMPLKTSVLFAEEGTYDVFVRVGDIAAADPDENLQNPTPLKFGIADQELKTYGAWDGTFLGTPGYNDYEVQVGQVTVAKGEQVDFIIDDATDYEGAQRSVYLGIRLAKQQIVDLPEINVNPGVREWFTDLGGNQYQTWPQDAAAYPTVEDWLTITTREDGSGKWNIREGLGPFGPILESFPGSGNDAMPLRTSVQFAHANTYTVYLRVGDIAAADPDENLQNPTPLKYGIEGQELRTFGAWDGVFLGTPGYNDYEVEVDQITVEAGEQVDFIIDDATDYEGALRSVYLGLRLERQEPSSVGDWSLY